MRKTDIYNKKPRLTEAYGFTVRKAIAELLVEIEKDSVLQIAFESKVKDFMTDLGIVKKDALEKAGARPEAKYKHRDVVTIPFGGHYYGYPSGRRFTTDDDPVRGLSPYLEGVLAPAGSLPVNSVINGFEIPAGVVIVAGAGNKIKTPASIALADLMCADDHEGFGMFRFGETFARYNKSHKQGALELAELMSKHRAVVFDSIKDLVTSIGGSAMDSGIARLVLVMLSELSMTAVEMGCTVIVPMNPTTQKDTVVELIGEIARSNVSMLVMATDNPEWPMVSRTGEGKIRISGTAKVQFVNDIPEIHVSPDSKGVATSIIEAVEKHNFSGVAHTDNAFLVKALLNTSK